MIHGEPSQLVNTKRIKDRAAMSLPVDRQDVEGSQGNSIANGSAPYIVTQMILLSEGREGVTPCRKELEDDSHWVSTSCIFVGSVFQHKEGEKDRGEGGPPSFYANGASGSTC